eukprot:CAMPEP_0205815008 /NCGR_PEP_ID=MMETSP0205-20121125/20448_1 /ASSEMBLY_ACC=CAM_ASM_000278 /TAXON_ID=36767 /ORGANISM="Euplotes focardii, Strain TN1" /LENGTH=31 /DNA_ID= /DNA_START= /DNA_END= /DNA_ORIENTATION=
MIPLIILWNNASMTDPQNSNSNIKKPFLKTD